MAQSVIANHADGCGDVDAPLGDKSSLNNQAPAAVFAGAGRLLSRGHANAFPPRSAPRLVTRRDCPPRAASSRFDEASIVPFTSSEKFVACVLETEAHRLSGVVRAPWSAYLGERDRAAWRARAGGRYCSPACLKEQKTGQFVLFRALIQSVQESAFRFR